MSLNCFWKSLQIICNNKWELGEGCNYLSKYLPNGFCIIEFRHEKP